MTGRLQVNIDPGANGQSPFLNWAKRVDGADDRLVVVNFTPLYGAAAKSAGHLGTDWEPVSPIDSSVQAYGFLFLRSQLSASGSGKPDYSGRQFRVEWTGTAVTGISGEGITSPDNSNVASNYATFYVTSDPSVNITLRLNVNPAAGTPPTDVKIFEVSKSAYVSAGDILDPDWVAYHKDFPCLRFLDPLRVNSSGATAFSDWATESFTMWGDSLITDDRKLGWPISVICNIANECNTAVWIPIPHKFTNDAVRQLAEAVRDTITWTGSEVRVYFEYSNECWNSSFAQRTYCNTQYQSEPLTDTLFEWYAYEASQKMEVIRTVFGTDSGNKWYGVLGAWHAVPSWSNEAVAGVGAYVGNSNALPFDAKTGNFTAGLVVTGGTSGATATIVAVDDNGTTGTLIVKGISGTFQNDETITDSSTGSATSNIPSGVAAHDTSLTKLFSGLAVAPYYGPTITTTASGTGAEMLTWAQGGQDYFNQQLYNKLKFGTARDGNYRNLEQLRYEWQQHKTITDNNSLDLIMYEGGWHGLLANPLRDGLSGETQTTLMLGAFSQFANSQLCAQLLYDMFTQATADGFVMCSQYMAMSNHSKYGQWGADGYLGDNKPRGSAARAFNASAPWQQKTRNMRVTLTSS